MRERRTKTIRATLYSLQREEGGREGAREEEEEGQSAPENSEEGTPTAHYFGTDSLRSFWKPAAEALPGKGGRRKVRAIRGRTFSSTTRGRLPTALLSMKLRRNRTVTCR